MIILTLPYPISANDYWGTRIVKPHGKPAMAMVYVTHEARGYKADVAKICRAAGILRPIEGRVEIGIRLYPHRPKDWETRLRKLGAAWADGIRCLDLDNVNKVLLDAIKDVAIADDKWVRSLQSERMEPDANGARVVVFIRAKATAVVQQSLLEAAA